MLSTLPKLADRSFILGYFLPTLLFSIVTLLLFRDLPTPKAWLNDLAAKDVTQAAYLLLMVWVAAVALLMVNHPLYRFLEGYTFPTWLAERLKARHQKRLQGAQEELKKLFARAAAEKEHFPAADLHRYRILKRDTARSLPSTSSDVLPTDFGNAIRAFELYPRDIYGADGVWVWLRLGAVLPKEFVEQVQESRTQVDFLVNCWLYSLGLSALALGRAIYAASHDQIPLGLPIAEWLAIGAGGLFMAHLFYRWAVSRVPAWGDLVMTAFDCYLPALAKQLGYELPPTEAERRAFWTAFSQQLIYRRDPDGDLTFRVDDWVTLEPKPAASSGLEATKPAGNVESSKDRRAASPEKPEDNGELEQ